MHRITVAIIKEYANIIYPIKTELQAMQWEAALTTKAKQKTL